MAVDVPSRSPRVRGLPSIAWSLIGRDADVATLTDLLTRTQLVTIVGPGGVGKTALAVEVARRLAPEFADGAAFVGLADLDDVGLISSEIARSLGLFDAGTDATDRLLAALRSVNMLVVVDNFEHLVDAAPVLSDLVSACPGISLLVTSRRRLGLSIERVVELAPLAVPGGTSDLEVASVALFCTHAAAVNSQFHADTETLRAVGELCRLVDGLPLAIELVASHVRLLTPDALLGRMRTVEDGFGFLRGGPVDFAPRHRDLRHTIGWSADLLGSVAARLLPRLSVFRDGWTLEAMESICCEGFTADEPLDALVELVDLHLVEPVSVSDGEPRFRLLETVRRFGAEALAETGDEDVVRTRHAEYFVALAVRAGRGLESREEQHWGTLVDRELPNVRVALQHLLASGRHDDGLIAASALGPYWLDRGVLREGQDWIDRFLPVAATTPAVRAVAEGWSVRLTIEQADFFASTRQDDRDERLRRAREVVDHEGDLAAWLRLTDHLATAVRLEGRYAEAYSLLSAAVGRCRVPDDAWYRAELLYQRALVADYLGQPDTARAAVEEALAAARVAGHDRARARALLALALVPGAPLTESRPAIEEAFRYSEGIGDRRGMAMNTVIAARFAFEDGDDEAAARWYVHALDHSLAVGYWRGVGWSVMGIAAVAERAGMLAEAARLHGALLTYLEASRSWVFPARMAYHGGVVDRLAAKLGDEFEELTREGARRPWVATIDEARRVLADVSRGATPATTPPGRVRGRQANPDLTERELDVLGALVAGWTNVQIAEELGISPKTVMHHTASIYRKLAVRGRAEAVAHALRSGMVSG